LDHQNMKVVLSSGHGKFIRGASGILDEVFEARRVVDRIAGLMAGSNVDITVFHDDISTTQNENLNRIVSFHNSQTRDLDISVHLNCFEQTEGPRGTECWYVTQAGLAAEISAAIARAGELIDRGAKKTTDLFFLNNTEQPAILIEVCFVDSEADAGLYQTYFDQINEAIADVLSETADAGRPHDDPRVLLHATGTCSWFGGPEDDGVAPDEGLAFICDVADAPRLFLPYQPPNTTGLARRLNPSTHYIACRWDYDVTSKDMLRGPDLALVRGRKTGIALMARPADYGPHSDTGRVADLSPSLLEDLGLVTDDEVEIIYPWRISDIRRDDDGTSS
jgi:N-acetylmuramoyl-L-alanine amidase